MRKIILILLCLPCPCFGQLFLDTGTGTANITSIANVGSAWTADIDRVVSVDFRLSTMNGAAATVTPVVQHLTSGDALIREYYFSAPKRTATDTVFGETITGIPVKSGEKIQFKALSTNGSDTSVTFSRSIVDWAYMGLTAPASQGGLPKLGANTGTASISGTVTLTGGLWGGINSATAGALVGTPNFSGGTIGTSGTTLGAGTFIVTNGISAATLNISGNATFGNIRPGGIVNTGSHNIQGDVVMSGNYSVAGTVQHLGLTSYATMSIEGVTNKSQTGDSFARIGATGSGLTSLAPSATALSTAVWTSTRAGYLDNLAPSAVSFLNSTTIATLASQTSFTLTAGSGDNDVYNGCIAVFTDQSAATQKAIGVVRDYVGSSKTVTLFAGPGFTIATGDTVTIMAPTSTRGGLGP